MTSDIERKRKIRSAWLILLVGVLMAHFYWFDAPIMVGIDPHEDRCLPEMHVALMIKKSVDKAERDDLLFWKPQGDLDHVKQAFVLKQVAGIPGDHLVIKGENVVINGRVVSEGMPLLDKTKVSPEQFERDEVIPPGMVFMRGTHPRSNDSRYWGYLPLAQVTGKAWEVF
jgi:conjugal transfer pilin signal peptidase TrbI